MQLPVVNLSPSFFPQADCNCPAIGPGQWLGWMQKAACICTNSFHGTAFAIICRKNFYCFPHQTRPKLNARVENLLKTFQLDDRLISDPHLMETGSSRFGDVDYDAVTPLFNAAVAASKEYLRNAVFGN
jgi:hypothetical protein